MKKGSRVKSVREWLTIHGVIFSQRSQRSKARKENLKKLGALGVFA
jgi:hypothetical protein